MIKNVLLAAAAVAFCTPAMAQAVPPIGIELEGEAESIDNATNTIVVMGMQVQVLGTTVLQTPTTTRADTPLGIAPFIRGATLPGRSREGFITGTAIVIGTWDAAAQKIVADEITMEPSENVALGALTASWCTTTNCDAAADYLRGGTKLGGGPYAAEGYYGDIAVSVPNTTGGTVSEKAFHYFLFDLVGYFPEMLLNKNIREVNAFRAQCRVGKDFEVRGHVHTLLTNTGAASGAILPTTGVVQVQYTVNGVLQRFSAAATAVDVGSPIGIYRVRFTPPGNTCPDTINVRWLPAANSANTAAYASATNYPVEIRVD